MNNKPPDHSLLPSAEEDRELALQNKQNKLLKQASSYQLAFDDQQFILRDEMRPVRLMLELSKTDLILNEHNINHTIVFFGSSRTPKPEVAKKLLAKANSELRQTPEDKIALRNLDFAVNQVKQANYYVQAKNLAELITTESKQSENALYVMTGGGPGIMEAANSGAQAGNGKSIALNIVLPKEQMPNSFISPELCFQFHYFAIRKMHFLMRARALVVFPGGYGTLDELFNALTLIQTQKMKPLPVLLFGRSYWESIINFDLMIADGMISSNDLNSFSYVESVEEAWRIIRDFIENQAQSKQ